MIYAQVRHILSEALAYEIEGPTVDDLYRQLRVLHPHHLVTVCDDDSLIFIDARFGAPGGSLEAELVPVLDMYDAEMEHVAVS